jgi:hypothetical protein
MKPPHPRLYSENVSCNRTQHRDSEVAAKVTKDRELLKSKSKDVFGLLLPTSSYCVSHVHNTHKAR